MKGKNQSNGYVYLNSKSNYSYQYIKRETIWPISNIFNWDICFCNCQMITETSIRSFQCAFEWMCTAYSGYKFTSSVLPEITMMRREMLMYHRDKCLPCMSLFLLLQYRVHSHAHTFSLTYSHMDIIVATHFYCFYLVNTPLLPKRVDAILISAINEGYE